MSDNPTSRGVFLDKVCNTVTTQARNRIPRINSILDTAPGAAGNITYNTPDQRPYYSDGLRWLPFVGSGSSAGCAVVFVVEEETTNPSNFPTINAALTAALTAGHNAANPAFLCICPSTVVPPYDEDVTAPPGINFSSPKGLGFSTLVSGRWTFDNTGFPPPPGTNFNDNFVTGIGFSHVSALGDTVTVTGPEEGAVRFCVSALIGFGMFNALSISGSTVDVVIDNSVVVNFGGPGISFTSGNLTITNTLQAFSLGDFLTMTSGGELNIAGSRIFSMGARALVLSTGSASIFNSTVVNLSAGATLETTGVLSSFVILHSQLANLATGAVLDIPFGTGGGLVLIGTRIFTFTGTCIIASSSVRATGCDLSSGGSGIDGGIILDIPPGCGFQDYTGCFIGNGSTPNPVVNVQPGLGMNDSVRLTGCSVFNLGGAGAPTVDTIVAASRITLEGCKVRSIGRCLRVVAAPPAPGFPKFIFVSNCRMVVIPIGAASAVPCVEIAAGLDPSSEFVFITGSYLEKFIGGAGPSTSEEVIHNLGSPMRLQNTTIMGINTLYAINMENGSMIEADNCMIAVGMVGFTVGGAAIRYDISSPSTLPNQGVNNELFLRNCRVVANDTSTGIPAIDCTSATANGNIRIYNSEIFSTAELIDNINSSVDIQTFNSVFRSEGITYAFTGAGGGTVTLGNMTFDTTLFAAAGALLAVNTGAAPSSILANADTTVAPPQIKDCTTLGAAGFGAKIDTTSGGTIVITPLASIEYF